MDVHNTAEEIAFVAMNQDFEVLTDLQKLTEVIETRIYELMDEEVDSKVGKPILKVVYKKEPDGDR